MAQKHEVLNYADGKVGIGWMNEAWRCTRMYKRMGRWTKGEVCVMFSCCPQHPREEEGAMGSKAAVLCH